MGPWASCILHQRGTGRRGFLQTGAVNFVARELRTSRKRKKRGPASGTRPGISFFLGFAAPIIGRTVETSPIVDLIHRPAAVRGAHGELHRVNLDIHETLQRYSRPRSRPN